jgi:O-antigen ligase
VLFLRVLIEEIHDKKNSTISSNNNFPVMLFFLIICVTASYLIVSDYFSDALVTAKVIIFPILFGYTVSKLILSANDVKSIVKMMLISSFVCFITAYIQYFFLNYEFAFFFNVAENISDTGEIVFTQSASKIMGFDRMYGVFGGPNELGLFTSLLALFILSILLYDRYQKLIRSKLYLYILITFAFSVLFLTFSRSSWIFLLIGIVVLSTRKGVGHFFLKIFFTFLFLATLALVFVQLFPDLTDIYSKTLTLEEGSAKGRPDEFVIGMEKVLENPMGLGLGKVIYRSNHPIFQTEIFWWMVLLEIGLIGGILLFGLQFSVLFRISSLFKKQFLNPFTITSFCCCAAFLVTGFGSTIVAEPVFLTFLWLIIGMGINNNVNNILYQSV